jgi:DNA (cytosine-5)-methyltransferase 1
VVAAIRPKWLVMENVTGITSIAGGAIVREITEAITNLGYRVEMQILRAEDFGVPQERRRIVFVATRTHSQFRFPSPTHGPGLLPYITIWDAISDLPPLRNGERAGPLPYACEPENDYQRAARNIASQVANHSAPLLAPVNEERMRHIPPGGSWRDLPIDLLPAGMRLAKRSDHTKRYGRPQKLTSHARFSRSATCTGERISTPSRIGQLQCVRRPDCSHFQIRSYSTVVERSNTYMLETQCRRCSHAISPKLY